MTFVVYAFVFRINPKFLLVKYKIDYNVEMGFEDYTITFILKALY